MNSDNYSGYIPGQENRPLIAGVNSPVERELLMPNEDWTAYQATHEIQNKGYETSACLLFSGTDCLEPLFKFLIEDDRIVGDDYKFLKDNGYLINETEVNFSDRYAANFANIVEGVGTYQYTANEALIKRLIPEKHLPYVNSGYYDKKQLSNEFAELAAEFYKRFTPNWYYEERVGIGLGSSPLQCIVRFANGDGVLMPEGRLNHGVACLKQIIKDEVLAIDDSYAQQNKRYNRNYVFSFVGYKITINKNMETEKFLRDNDLAWVQNEVTGQFARIMQGMLRPIISSDRGALLLLDDKVRENKIIKNGKTVAAKITADEWQKLPKKDF